MDRLLFLISYRVPRRTFLIGVLLRHLVLEEGMMTENRSIILKKEEVHETNQKMSDLVTGIVLFTLRWLMTGFEMMDWGVEGAMKHIGLLMQSPGQGAGWARSVPQQRAQSVNFWVRMFLVCRWVDLLMPMKGGILTALLMVR